MCQLLYRFPSLCCQASTRKGSRAHLLTLSYLPSPKPSSMGLLFQTSNQSYLQQDLSSTPTDSTVSSQSSVLMTSRRLWQVHHFYLKTLSQVSGILESKNSAAPTRRFLLHHLLCRSLSPPQTQRLTSLMDPSPLFAVDCCSWGLIQLLCLIETPG